VFGVYVVTLAIFPGFLVEDITSDALGDWYPILLMATFNAADVVGKFMPTHPRLREDGPTLLRAVSLRACFIPVFGACALGSNESLRSEGVIVTLTAALGLSSGYLATAAMVAAPKRVTQSEQEPAGTIMVFWLIGGLSVGALCGWLWLLL
jgi:equilibrative nucleoside transporter 1/2/3